MSTTKQTFTIGPVAAAVIPPLTKTIAGQDYTFDLSGACDAAIAYVLAYGFSQTMGDTQAVGAAGLLSAAVKAEVITKEDAKAAKGAGDASNEKLEAWIKADPKGPAFETWAASFLAKRAASRLSDILSGDMVFGETERLTPEEKDRREITLRILKDVATAQGVKLPKDAASLKEMLDFVYADQQALIDAEVATLAKRRAATAGKVAGSDLGARLAGLLKG